VTVRAQGLLAEITDVDAADHVCWMYDDRAAFDDAVRAFVAGGLARGERLLCVGERVIDSLRGQHPSVADVDALLADGAIETLTIAQAHDATGRFLPERQLEFYDGATRRAISDGYGGCGSSPTSARSPSTPPGDPTWLAGSTSPTTTSPMDRGCRRCAPTVPT
jgi:hypothetical protein